MSVPPEVPPKGNGGSFSTAVASNQPVNELVKAAGGCLLVAAGTLLGGCGDLEAKDFRQMRTQPAQNGAVEGNAVQIAGVE